MWGQGCTRIFLGGSAAWQREVAHLGVELGQQAHYTNASSRNTLWDVGGGQRLLIFDGLPLLQSGLRLHSKSQTGIVVCGDHHVQSSNTQR